MTEKTQKTAKKPVKKVTRRKSTPKAEAKTKPNTLEDKIEKLKAEAERKGLTELVLFEELLDEFYYQTSLLHRLRAEIDGGQLTTQKTYIKGQPNTSPNKLVATYNATSNARVNTVGAISKLIKSFGAEDDTSQDPLAKIMLGG